HGDDGRRRALGRHEGPDGALDEEPAPRLLPGVRRAGEALGPLMSAVSGEGLDVLLVDGSLRPAKGGATVVTLNPATEEPLGAAADGSAEDMDAAIAAARAAFDEGSWAADPAFRARCLRQLRDALQSHGDELRALTTAEVGAPVFLTNGPQFDVPVDDLGFAA